MDTLVTPTDWRMVKKNKKTYQYLVQYNTQNYIVIRIMVINGVWSSTPNSSPNLINNS